MPPIEPSGNLQQVIALRQQLLERHDALRQLQNPQAQATAASPAAPQRGFAESLGDALAGVNAAQLRAGELSAAYERGEVADIAQVMLARQEAGIAFEATLQVRNKLLSAYQDIMRMGA